VAVALTRPSRSCPSAREGLKLRFEHGDRVRLIVASCLTVVAMPYLLREGKEQRAERPPTVAAVAPGAEALASPTGDGAQPAAAPVVSTPAPDPTTTDVGPGFLSGPTFPTVARTIVVAVPTTNSPTTQEGRASFRRWRPGSTTVGAPCAAWFLPVGTTVTVTNVDNGHTVNCVIAERTGVPDDQVIVLDTPVFEQLADLIEAPVPVTISWR
jgi:hypothetical protein